MRFINEDKLSFLKEALADGQVKTVKEIRAKNKDYGSEVVRKALMAMMKMGIVEIIELKRQPATRFNPARRAKIGYRLKQSEGK